MNHSNEPEFLLTPSSNLDLHYSDSDDESIESTQLRSNEHFIDPLQPVKPPNTTRLYFQNLNGVTLDTHGGTWSHVCENSAATQIDMLLFSELNKDTTQHFVQYNMMKVCKKHFKTSRLTTASSPVKATTTFKPGGTGVLSIGDITSRIHSTIRDRLGRWCVIRLKGPHRKISVIAAYQVCKSSTKGTFTVYNQQHSLLLQEALNSDSPLPTDPRRAFREDLQHQIQKIFKRTEIKLYYAGISMKR